MSSVRVEAPDPHNRYIVMTWERNIVVTDVHHAFEVVMNHLEETETLIYVVVDITANPRFPVTQTVAEAMPPHQHEMMAGWLVIGENILAKSIERVLSTMTQRKRIHWFDTIQDALDYIESSASNG